ncbi:MAG TPA: hypothetical protein VJK71_07770 [Gemmatimonadales bacterium]|nr:hypothetical protein [Gemmatimonadales bacterium]
MLQFARAVRWCRPIFALLLLVPSVSGQSPLPGEKEPRSGRITRTGVARAQAVVDSVFLDRFMPEGYIEGGDWASYLMARLGVEPIPENTEIQVVVDTEHVEFSGRLQDLPQEARAVLGPLGALVDTSTVIAAEIIQLPAGRGLAHFRLERVRIGGFPMPETVLRYMLMDVGERYPALTKSGRDLYVQIPPDGQVNLASGAVRLRIVNAEKSP